MCNLFGRIGGDAELSERGLKVCTCWLLCIVVVRIINYDYCLVHLCGPVAQWIRHLTTNQGIPGSSPGRVAFFFLT